MEMNTQSSIQVTILSWRASFLLPCAVQGQQAHGCLSQPCLLMACLGSPISCFLFIPRTQSVSAADLATDEYIPGMRLCFAYLDSSKATDTGGYCLLWPCPTHTLPVFLIAYSQCQRSLHPSPGHSQSCSSHHPMTFMYSRTS